MRDLMLGGAARPYEGDDLSERLRIVRGWACRDVNGAISFKKSLFIRVTSVRHAQFYVGE